MDLRRISLLTSLQNDKHHEQTKMILKNSSYCCKYLRLTSSFLYQQVLFLQCLALSQALSSPVANA